MTTQNEETALQNDAGGKPPASKSKMHLESWSYTATVTLLETEIALKVEPKSTKPSSSQDQSEKTQAEEKSPALIKPDLTLTEISKKSGYLITLERPVTTGTLADLLAWMDKTFGTALAPASAPTENEIAVAQKTATNSGPISEMLVALWGMQLTLNKLVIDTSENTVELSVGAKFEKEFSLLNVIGIKEFGLTAKLSEKNKFPSSERSQ